MRQMHHASTLKIRLREIAEVFTNLWKSGAASPNSQPANRVCARPITSCRRTQEGSCNTRYSLYGQSTVFSCHIPVLKQRGIIIQQAILVQQLRRVADHRERHAGTLCNVQQRVLSIGKIQHQRRAEMSTPTRPHPWTGTGCVDPIVVPRTGSGCDNAGCVPARPGWRRTREAIRPVVRPDWESDYRLRV